MASTTTDLCHASKIHLIRVLPIMPAVIHGSHVLPSHMHGSALLWCRRCSTAQCCRGRVRLCSTGWVVGHTLQAPFQPPAEAASVHAPGLTLPLHLPVAHWPNLQSCIALKLFCMLLSLETLRNNGKAKSPGMSGFASLQPRVQKTVMHNQLYCNACIDVHSAAGHTFKCLKYSQHADHHSMSVLVCDYNPGWRG